MNRLRVAIAAVVVIAIATVAIVGATSLVGVDGDDEPAFAELAEGTDPLAADSDGDGLDDTAEQAAGTNPTNPDSDDDGLEDGPEVDAGADPLTADTDGDGLEDGDEVHEHGTDPTAADTDEDGLDDGEEVNEYGTDPTAADSDADGLEDGAEIETYGTEPTVADTDGDGLEDGPEVNQYGTNPQVADSDSDGLDDGAEVTIYGTDPGSADTDADGLDDGAEVDVYATDPADADTDADGLEDGEEVATYGTDPTDDDTDGDGLLDGPEVHQTQLYPGADPLRTDVYVEVDVMQGTSLPYTDRSEIVDRFANAPISNPDGSTGISLHFEHSDVVPAESTTSWEGSYQNYRAAYKDYGGEGYHYLLIVEDAYSSGTNVAGVASSPDMMVQYFAYEDYTGSTVMHELGHSLGLYSSTFNGVDSYRYDYWEYPSVMNYNAPGDAYGFSNGDASIYDFDDWGYIEDNMYTPPTYAVTVED
ncbi:hypothetical protein GCM10028857_24860 [Salinarchaeum chitinilyticum]